MLACHLAAPCDRRCIAWFPSVNMSFGYTLNFDLVTDAASRGFFVLACRLATPCDRRCIAWFPCDSMSFGYTLLPTLHRAVSRRQRVILLHLVTDAASRGFLVLACHLAIACYRRCIARFHSVSVSFGCTCDGRCIAWFPSVIMSFGYTLLPTLHRVVSMC